MRSVSVTQCRIADLEIWLLDLEIWAWFRHWVTYLAYSCISLLGLVELQQLLRSHVHHLLEDVYLDVFLSEGLLYVGDLRVQHMHFARKQLLSQRHLIKLGYRCPECQHGLCTACNEIEGHIQCPWCMEPFPQVPHGHQQQARSGAYTTQCLNIHGLGEQWIEEVTDVEEVHSRKSALRKKSSSSRPISEGGKQRLGRKDVNNC